MELLNNAVKALHLLGEHLPPDPFKSMAERVNGTVRDLYLDPILVVCVELNPYIIY